MQQYATLCFYLQCAHVEDDKSILLDKKETECDDLRYTLGDREEEIHNLKQNRNKREGHIKQIERDLKAAKEQIER